MIKKFDLRLLIYFFLQHFEKLKVNVIPKSIYMEEQYAFKKHTECSDLNTMYVYLWR